MANSNMIARDVVEIVAGVVLGVGFIALFTGNVIALLEPDTFANAFEGTRWSLITMTTVGYGDVVPQSPGGRFLAGGLTVIGLAVVVVVTGVVSYKVGCSMRTPIQCQGCRQPITPNFPFCPYCGKQCPQYGQHQDAEADEFE